MLQLSLTRPDSNNPTFNTMALKTLPLIGTSFLLTLALTACDGVDNATKPAAPILLKDEPKLTLDSKPTLLNREENPLLIAPMIEGVDFCERVIEEKAAPSSLNYIYCDQHNFEMGSVLSSLLNEIEPEGAAGKIQVGYTYVISLTGLYSKQEDSWVIDPEKIEKIFSTVKSVGRPVVLYLMMNHFDSRNALAQELADSPIRRFGGPMDLTRQPKAPRAIQTLGPSGAMLYFARLLPGGSRYGLHGARARVDRIFNVILGGPSLVELADFYRDTLGMRVGEPMGFAGTLAAEACGAPPDTVFPICVAPVRARNSLLELDEYPENSAPRPRDEGCIPGGMSMVTFLTPSLDDFPVALRAAPASLDCFPYSGARVAVAEGPAGEWLELIESI